MSGDRSLAGLALGQQRDDAGRWSCCRSSSAARRSCPVAGQRDRSRDRPSAFEARALLRELRLEGLHAEMCSPSPDAMTREDVELLERAFDGLLADYRAVITQPRILGLSHAEIAAEMGKSEGAVRVLVHRALVRLGRLTAAARAGPAVGELSDRQLGAFVQLALGQRETWRLEGIGGSSTGSGHPGTLPATFPRVRLHVESHPLRGLMRASRPVSRPAAKPLPRRDPSIAA